ncbi:MAG: dihydroorotase [Treponema sp.]|nr:dihydroorotase [Treponema sp.]
MKDLMLIYNARLIDAEHDVKNGALLLRGGRIEGILTKPAIKKIMQDDSVGLYDAHGLVVMPSFIDMHAHFRDPGLTQKEDIETGSKAAAAGGFGTVVLMPNTNPVVSSMQLAEENNRKAKEFGYCQVIQSVSITKDFDGVSVSHIDELKPKVVPLITEDGHEVTDSAVMLEAMKKASKKNLIVSCHCEDPFLAAAARPLRKQALELIAQGKKSKASSLLQQADIILALAEDTATLRNIRLAEEAGCHLHLCHVSTGQCIDAVRRAKASGINVTCEITPHHIGLTGGKSQNVFHIVNPPLRSEGDRICLIQALLDGTADVIATDHAPHTEQDKVSGSPGFSGLETAFGVCNSVLVKENGMSLQQLSQIMSERPARLLGFDDRGTLNSGNRADLVVIDPDEEWTVHGYEFASKGKYTPLEGKKLTGNVVATFFNGNIVFQQ